MRPYDDSLHIDTNTSTPVTAPPTYTNTSNTSTSNASNALSTSAKDRMCNEYKIMRRELSYATTFTESQVLFLEETLKLVINNPTLITSEVSSISNMMMIMMMMIMMKIISICIRCIYVYITHIFLYSFIFSSLFTSPPPPTTTTTTPTTTTPTTTTPTPTTFIA